MGLFNFGQKKQLWIDEAEPKQQGSFCDVDSGYTHHNVDGFTADQERRNTEHRGEEVFDVNAPLGDIGSYEPDQRYNVHFSESDGQGFSTPRKHDPGR